MPDFGELAADIVLARLESNLFARERFHVTPAAFGGAAANIFYIAGFPADNAALPTGTPSIDTLCAVPFFSGGYHDVNLLGFSVTTVGGAGSVARVGIYQSDPQTFYPTALVVDGGQHDTSAVGGTGFKTTSLAGMGIQLRGRLYWFVYIAGVSAPTVKVINGSGAWPFFGYSNNLTNRQSGMTVARAYGALPATFPAGAVPGGATQTAIGVRFE